MAARSVLPHGGGAVAILIAGIVVGGITLTVAVDRRANPVIWPLAAFLITVLACSLVLDALS